MNGNNTGSTWRAMRLPGPARANIFASTDAWVAPILAKTGPDGALWVLDWYNYLFLHNPANPRGAGGAWDNHLRTKTRNRIYRVAPVDGALEPILNLTAASIPQLVATFSNPNLQWRLHAQRLLLARGYSAELGAMLENILAADRAVDDVGNNPRVLHALWTLHGLGRFDMVSEQARWNPILSQLLLHPSVGVRRNVLKAMPRIAASAQAISDRCSANDSHGHVRLQAFIALSEIPNKPSGLKPVWSTYGNVDFHATVAFALSGMGSSADLPCSPTLYPVSTYRPEAASQPRGDLRFSLGREGFRLKPHGQLPSGDLVVYDSRGRVAFRSRYRAGEARWTRPMARGLASPLYLYEFRGSDGSLIKGRISLAQNL